MLRIKSKRLKKILSYLRPYWGIELEIGLCIILGMLFSLLTPILYKILVDDVLINKNAQLLGIVVLVYVVLYLFSSGIGFIRDYLFTFLGQRLVFDIRSDLFQHIQKLPHSFYNQTKTGDILARLYDDVSLVQGLLTRVVFSLITDLFSLLVILLILFLMDWKLTLLALGTFPIFLVLLYFFSGKIKIQSKKLRGLSGEFINFLTENVTGYGLIRSFTAEKNQEMEHLRRSKELINQNIWVNLLGMLSGTSTGLVAQVGYYLILWFGGLKVIHNDFSLGTLLAYTAYFWRIFGPLQNLIRLNVNIQTASASIERIFDFLDEPPRIKSKPNALRRFQITGDIEFKNVSFSYGAKDKILKGLNFKIEPGQIIALIGPSGSGKTTLAHLLMRFYDPCSGSILIDGRDIKDFDLKRYRKQVGLVSQESFLFNTSIEENLRFGKKDANLMEIEKATQLAHIFDFISHLPQRFQTQVGNRGTKLSGGQRQRISLARTILKEPRVLILDEATSSVDQKTERLILSSLRNHFRNKSIIIISHRTSLLQIADRIFCLNQGFVEEVDKATVLSESEEGIDHLKALDNERIRFGY
jgi:ABC-type bacteriocin/lantibiotic exporter with double-glycine peptidase domain